MKVKYTEPPHCEVKGFCDKLRPNTERGSVCNTEYEIDCEACWLGQAVHTAEVLDFCANDKGVYAVLLRDDGRIVARPLRYAEMYIDQPETRETPTKLRS